MASTRGVRDSFYVPTASSSGPLITASDFSRISGDIQLLFKGNYTINQTSKIIEKNFSNNINYKSLPYKNLNVTVTFNDDKFYKYTIEPKQVIVKKLSSYPSEPNVKVIGLILDNENKYFGNDIKDVKINKDDSERFTSNDDRDLIALSPENDDYSISNFKKYTLGEVPSIGGKRFKKKTNKKLKKVGGSKKNRKNKKRTTNRKNKNI